jgi:hypothetical protein
MGSVSLLQLHLHQLSPSPPLQIPRTVPFHLSRNFGKCSPPTSAFGFCLVTECQSELKLSCKCRWKCRIGTSLHVHYLLHSSTGGLLLTTPGLKINIPRLQELDSTSIYIYVLLLATWSHPKFWSSYPSSSLSLHACQIVIDTRSQMDISSQSCLFQAEIRIPVWVIFVPF